MKKLMMLAMLLLTVCSSACAESLDEVLKDCKLDRNRWQVVEWFKDEQAVRLFDSTSIQTVAPNQYEVTIYIYFYGNDCGAVNCNYRKIKHYHSEKCKFDTKASTVALMSLGTVDDNLNVVESLALSSNLQIPVAMKRNSLYDKTMQKTKAFVKDDKKFEAVETKENVVTIKKNTTGFAPLPQPIGTKEGEWTYLGRFVGSSNLSYVENILLMESYESNSSCDGVFDVYYFHKHGEGSIDEGSWCHVDRNHGNAFYYGYSCILKFVPLDKNGNRIQSKGIYTDIVSVTGGSKGDYGYSVKQVRRFDTSTHELVTTKIVKYNPSTHRSDIEETIGNNTTSRRPNPLQGYLLSSDFYRKYGKRTESNPYWRAAENSNCPHNFDGPK